MHMGKTRRQPILSGLALCLLRISMHMMKKSNREGEAVSLKEYLEENGVDDMEDDGEFMEAEYHMTHVYCESRNYILGPGDLAAIIGRGLEGCYEDWVREREENGTV